MAAKQHADHKAWQSRVISFAASRRGRCVHRPVCSCKTIGCHTVSFLRCTAIEGVAGVAIRTPKPSPPGKVARASPTSARRMRVLPLPMGEVPLEGAERACLPSQSLCDSSPKVGAKEKRIVTGGNPWKGPHQCEHWFAMTCVYFGAEKAGGRWPPLHCGFLICRCSEIPPGLPGYHFW